MAVNDASGGVVAQAAPKSSGGAAAQPGDEQAGDYETLVKTFIQPARVMRSLTDYILFTRTDGELAKAVHAGVSVPITLPAEGEWLLRTIASRGEFVFGLYRRHMKTIGHLGRIDQHFGAPATTRSWNTIRSVVRILKSR